MVTTEFQGSDLLSAPQRCHSGLVSNFRNFLYFNRFLILFRDISEDGKGREKAKEQALKTSAQKKLLLLTETRKDLVL